MVVLGNWRKVWCLVDAFGMLSGYICIGLWLWGRGEREEKKLAGVFMMIAHFQ
jgi:hypothetical protein